MDKRKEEKNFNDILQNEDFSKWFWKGKNGNKVIAYLNKHQTGNDVDRIRREKMFTICILNDLKW